MKCFKIKETEKTLEKSREVKKIRTEENGRI